MDTELIIRKAMQKDINSMVGLLRILFAIEADFSFDEKKQGLGLEMLLEEPNNSCVLVAEQRHEIVGMCSAQLLVSTAEGGLKVIIEDVVVDNSYRGKGIGRQLLTSIAEWAANKGALRVDLLADRRNSSALEFYEKLHWSSTELVCLQKRI